MSDNDLERAIKEISKDIDALKSLKEKLDSICSNSGEDTKAIDLQKVQVLDNHFNSWFNFMGGIAAGGLILLITVSVTVYYTLSIIGGFIGFGISAATGVYVIFEMRRNHKGNLKKINKFITIIETKGGRLPSVVDLDRNKD